ncbi:MAG: cation diffusion facilitator family transporter [Vicinamibacteria bacterium]
MSREIRAIQVAIACSIIGTLTKTTVGVITGSMTMISSAVDSAGDLMVSVANLFVVRLSDRAPDEDHNYGHAKIEGLGAMFEGGFIMAAGTFIIYEALHKAMIGEVSHDSLLGIAVMVPLIVLTAGTVVYLRRVARETGSLVIKADALHYATDVYVNVGVLVALSLVWVTHEPLIDTVISIGIALYMLWSSVHIVREGFDVVMDRSLDKRLVDQVGTLLSGCNAIESFHDFRTRSGKIPHVDFHVVVRPDMTAREVHDLYLALRAQIREVVGPTTKVLMHADPAGARE